MERMDRDEPREWFMPALRRGYARLAGWMVRDNRTLEASRFRNQRGRKSQIECQNSHDIWNRRGLEGAWVHEGLIASCRHHFYSFRHRSAFQSLAIYGCRSAHRESDETFLQSVTPLPWRPLSNDTEFPPRKTGAMLVRCRATSSSNARAASPK